MNEGDNNLSATQPRSSQTGRLLIVLAGLLLSQALLYGPCLIGRKLLLPLDILAGPRIYLPQGPDTTAIQPHNLILSDLIFLFEPERRFANAEFHAGRLPMWAPYHFAGAPFVWPKFSLLLAVQAVFKSPVAVAWGQLFAAVVAGFGAWFFCQRALTISFWPSTFAAWCYPLTGFFILQQGFTLVLSIYWLPWLLLAVDRTTRTAQPLAPLGLALVTGLATTSGQLDVAGQVLLISVCFAVWSWLECYRKECFKAQGRRALAKLAAAFCLGLMLATPYMLPVWEYSKTGARVAHRTAGGEERAPVGLAALPQVVLPRMYGSTQLGSLPLYPKKQGNLEESSAGAYAGLLATLFAAPLALSSRRHRPMNLFWVGSGAFGLAWCLNVPGIVPILRLPGLNLMSHNRLVFVTAFALVVLAAVGLHALWEKSVRWRAWFWIPLAVLVGLGAWCTFRACSLPEPVRKELADAIKNGEKNRWVRDLSGVANVQSWFIRSYATAAAMTFFGTVGWLLIWRRKFLPSWLVCLLGLVMTAELIWFAFGRFPQSDPSLYYPRLPVLEKLAASPPGRVIGYSCLPALLATSHNLKDVRGYDPIVPGRLWDLMQIAADQESTVFNYGLMQWLTPKAGPDPQGNIRLSPLMDMLNVRYVIFRGSPAPSDHPFLQGPDYWVLTNSGCMDRAYIPLRTQTITQDKELLEKLASPDFDPRGIACVESPLDLPMFCHGAVEIVAEIPTRITLVLRMETPGLVVLGDLWDKGWRAYLNGQLVPIYRVNHAIRGVVAPQGPGKLEFRYEPEAFVTGLGLAGLAALMLVGWFIILWRKARNKAEPAARKLN